MKEAKLGTLKIIDACVLRRLCFGVCAAIFTFGLFLGSYTTYSIVGGTPSMIARPLIDLGDYLCREWDGLAEIGRVDKKHYAFRCHSLAVFPEVELTIKKEQTP